MASAADFRWDKKSTIEIGCLKLNAEGLWACSTEKSGFVVGLSTDEGATFKPQLHFCDIRGPLDCAVGSTTHTECTLGGTSSTRTPPWPSQRALLGCGGRDPDGGAASAGDASSNAAGSALAAGGGCALRTPSPGPFAALFAGVAAAIALARRLRRDRAR